MDQYQKYREWEVLDEFEIVQDLTFEKGIYKFDSNCNIKIFRDYQYKLQAELSGISTEEIKTRHDERAHGTIIEGENIIGYSADKLYKYILKNVIVRNTHSTLSFNRKILFKCQLFVDEIKKEVAYEFNHELKSIQEWFLCGRIDIAWTRSTNRKVEKKHSRIRAGIDTEKDIIKNQSRSTSNDFLLCNTSEFSFIVAKVPKHFGPIWSNNLSIEYRKSFKRIPNREERTAVAEVIGFIFGQQLLIVGQTTYCIQDSIIEQEFESPWGDNVVDRCSQGGLPPIKINNFLNRNEIEEILNQVVPIYLQKRNDLNLSLSLWKYWIAKYSPIGVNLPVLSSAVESLADRMLKFNPNIKLSYIDFGDYLKLIHDEIKSIEGKLQSLPFKDRIINKIKSSANRGGNEKLDIMFELLKLDIGKIEKKAIKARNKMAHSSSSDLSDEKLQEVIKLTRAYETLFNRTILKILTYNKTYVDYYTNGFPLRKLKECIPDISIKQ